MDLLHFRKENALKKCFPAIFIVLFLLLTTGCQSVQTAGQTPEQAASPTETSLPSPTSSETATANPSPTGTAIPSPTIYPPTTPISIENAARLQPFKIIGKQFTVIPRGFRTMLSPTFDVYVMVENPDELDNPLVLTFRDANSGAVLYTVTGDSGAEFTAVFSPDGRFFAIGNDQAAFSVWNVKTGERILHGDLKLPVSPYSRLINRLVFSPDGNLLITVSSAGRFFAVWDLTQVSIGASYSCREGLACEPFAFSPDGKFLVVQAGQRIPILDGKTGNYIQEFAKDDYVVTAFAFSPAGDLLAVLDRSLDISVYEFPGGKLVHSLPLDKSIFRNYSARPSLEMGTAISFSPDGKLIASGYTNGFFILWNVESEQAVFVYKNAKSQWYSPAGEYSAILGIRFSKDGTMLASESADNSVAIWGVP